MSKLEKICIPLIIGVVAIAYAMSHVMANKAFALHWMIREDGLLESITTIVLLISAILFWSRCWQLRHCRPALFLWCTAIYGCIMFFGMGEEISWGQRIFNIETPEFFANANRQNETNLHNLMVGSTNINKLIFGKLLALGLLCYLIPLPYFYRKSEAFRDIVSRLALPIPRLHHSAFILSIALLVETSPATKHGEITEFALTSLVLLLLLNPLNATLFQTKANARRVPQSQPDQLQVAA